MIQFDERILKNGLVQPPTFVMHFPRILIEEMFWKPLSNLKSTGFFCVAAGDAMESEHGSLCTTALFEQSATSSKSMISIKTPKVLAF